MMGCAACFLAWPVSAPGLGLLVLATALLVVAYDCPKEWLLYPGLMLIVAVALWD